MSCFKLLFTVSLSVFVLAGCPAKPAGQETSPSGTAEETPIQAVSAVCLNHNSSFYALVKETTKDASGNEIINMKWKWVDYLMIGEALEYPGESVKAPLTYKKGDAYVTETFDLVHILRDEAVYGKDADGYTFPFYIADNASIGVIVVDNAKKYSKPSTDKLEASTLKRGLICAVLSSESTPEFYKIQYYAGGKITTYVDRFSINMERNSTEAARALYMAQIETKPEMIVNRAEIALSKYSPSAFDKDLMDLLEAQNREDFTAYMYVLEDDTPVYEEPSMNGQIIGTLSSGMSVETVKKTKQESEYNGVSGFWYQMKENPKGWVHASQLTEGR